ncbi:NADP-dependent oxidoreductase [Paenibacillus tianmuensis]|nr:NADP-dependent oxidoreductase [Paenibacillus tianmuensis]
MIIEQYGEADQFRLEDVPLPSIHDGEVLVNVYAAGVNPVDWKIREGHLQRIYPYAFPLIIGCDVAGVVVKVGPGVKKYKVGDAVYGFKNLAQLGGYAEFVKFNENDLARKPDSLSFVEAASVPVVGLAAWQIMMVHGGGIKPGDRVFIQGGAGGVGSFAVQLAKSMDAYVITTASKQNQTFLKELGADEVIDYREHDFSTVISSVDILLDTIGGDALDRSYDLVKKGGKLLSIVERPNKDKAAKLQIHTHFIPETESNGKMLEEISLFYKYGKLKPVVEHIFPFAQAAEAHRLSETKHTRGKIVLELFQTSPLST